MHGGATPRGLDHPRYRGRGYTKDIPARLAERLAKAMEDPQLISMVQEIGLVDARIGELFPKLGTKESADAWRQVHAAKAQIEAAVADVQADLQEKRDPAQAFERLAAATRSVGDALSVAYAERQIWHEILDHVEVRRRLVDTELKREAQLEATMTARQTMTFIGALHLILSEELTDPEAKRRVAGRLRQLLYGGEAPRALLGPGSSAQP